MGVPYEIKPMSNIPLAGTPIVIEIDYPNRCVVSKIVVVQTSGTAENFSVGIYNHPQVMDGDVSSDTDGPDIGPIPDDCYRVTPELTATNGKLLYFSDQATGGYGYTVFSQKQETNRQGQGSRKIYLKITPASSGDKRIAICVGGQKDM